MSRAHAFLLAFMLLFQTSWAMAATYCTHDTSPTAAAHFGHHAHVHESVDSSKKQSASPLTVDDDCGFCHASHAALPATGLVSVVAQAPAAVDVPSPRLHRSATDRVPDRPQWLRLA